MMGRRRRMLVVPDSREARESRPAGTADGPAPFDPSHRGEWWWRQPKWTQRRWRLEQDGRLAGVFEGEGLFSMTSRMHFAGASFEMHRGWLGHIDLRTPGGSEPLARFKSNLFGGGRVEPVAGETLDLVKSGILWKHAHELRTADGLGLVRFESQDYFLSHEVQIVPEDAARRRLDLLPLLALAAAVIFAPKRHHG